MEATEERSGEKKRKDIRCPIHGKLLGRYDPQVGAVNVTLFCPTCKKEYTFTFSPSAKKT